MTVRCVCVYVCLCVWEKLQGLCSGSFICTQTESGSGGSLSRMVNPMAWFYVSYCHAVNFPSNTSSAQSHILSCANVEKREEQTQNSFSSLCHVRNIVFFWTGQKMNRRISNPVKLEMVMLKDAQCSCQSTDLLDILRLSYEMSNSYLRLCQIYVKYDNLMTFNNLGGSSF